MSIPEQQSRPESAQQQIDDLIAGLDDWRGERLAEVRGLIHGALPGVSETWKWMGSPVWEQDGIVVVGNAHKAKVKLTFPQGAQLVDPDDRFNAGLGGSVRPPTSWTSALIYGQPCGCTRRKSTLHRAEWDCRRLAVTNAQPAVRRTPANR